MRRLLAALSCLALTALPACGSDDEAPPATTPGTAATSSATTGATGSAAPAFPVTVAHEHGSTTVAAAPTRVVTVGYTEHEIALALGVVPVGVLDWLQEQPRQQWPWVAGRYVDGVPPAVGTGGSPLNLEQIARLDPDLILATSQIDGVLDKALYDRLSAIAPVVAQPAAADNAGVGWRVLTRATAAALGRTAEAERQITALEARFAQVRQAHPEWATQTAAFTDGFQAPKSYGVFAAADSRGQFLAELGFRADPALEALMEGSFSTVVAQENTPSLGTDRLLTIASPERQRLIEADALYAALPATKAGRDLFLPSLQAPFIGAALSYNTILSLPYALDQVLPLLEAQS